MVHIFCGAFSTARSQSTCMWDTLMPASLPLLAYSCVWIHLAPALLWQKCVIARLLVPSASRCRPPDACKCILPVRVRNFTPSVWQCSAPTSRPNDRPIQHQASVQSASTRKGHACSRYIDCGHSTARQHMPLLLVSRSSIPGHYLSSRSSATDLELRLFIGCGAPSVCADRP